MFYISKFIDNLLDRYAAGYVEILGSVFIQLLYLLNGLIVEMIRPPYTSVTSFKMILQSLRNHLIATALHITYVICHDGSSVLTRTFIRPYRTPAMVEFGIHMLIGIFLWDFIFWFIHFVWHLPGIYEWIHAKHHEVKNPREHHVWTISFMSIVDFVFLYGLPVVAVAKILEMNIITTLAFALYSAVGEQTKLAFGDVAHDEHHRNGKCNFGSLGLADRMMGTNATPTAEDKSRTSSSTLLLRRILTPRAGRVKGDTTL